MSHHLRALTEQGLLRVRARGRERLYRADREALGTLVTEWSAKKADGADMGKGTNVFTLDADGKILDVVGIWAG